MALSGAQLCDNGAVFELCECAQGKACRQRPNAAVVAKCAPHACCDTVRVHSYVLTPTIAHMPST